MSQAKHITRAHDLARILWLYFRSTDDTHPHEGHVREFGGDGLWVRIAETTEKEDKGRWFRVSDIRLVAVLAERVETTAKPKRERKPRLPKGDATGQEEMDHE